MDRYVVTVSGAHGGKEKTSDPLDLETAVSLRAASGN